MYNVGDIVYVDDSRYGWLPACVIRRSGSYYHIRLLDRKCGFGVPEHRLISEADYLALPKKDDAAPPRAPFLH